MKLQKAIFSALFLVGAQARVGRETKRRKDVLRKPDKEDDGSVEIVVTFKDDEADAFEDMSTTFTNLPESVEVHSMLKNLKMATVRAKPSAVAALMASPRVESVDPDVEFHQDFYREARLVSSNEPTSSSAAMAIGSQPIPPFMKPVRGCDDPNTVKVAVIDGGMDASHPDFSFCNQGFCQGMRFSEPTEQDWGVSRNDHGNHVTGIIAASGLNGGMANGMVSDGKICIAIGRVFNDKGTGATLTAVVDSLDWAIEQKAHIVNMSFGISVDLTALHEAIIRVRKAGILAVASGGNSGSLVENYPAYYPETFAVGAVDDSKNWASFNTYNDRINLMAPGVGIVSTLPGNRIGTMDGTSMATPFVSGAAALMKRACMKCTDQDIWQCLVNTAEPISSCGSEKCGAGFLQAGAAYQCLQNSPCCVEPEQLTNEEEIWLTCEEYWIKKRHNHNIYSYFNT
eukprot:scaffold715_cov164-Amphora_coffeaeformis.AAC.7